MSNQLYEEGDTLAKGLVVTGVQYQEDSDGNRSAFTYLVRSVNEVEGEKKVQAEIERRQAELEEEARLEAERNRPDAEATPEPTEES